MGSKGSQKSQWRDSEYISENREYRNAKRILFSSAEEDEERWTAYVEPNSPRPHKDVTKPQKQREFIAHVGDEFVTTLITRLTYSWENNQLIPLNVEQEGADYMPRIKQPSSRSHSAPQWKFKKVIEKVSYYGDEYRHTKVVVAVTTWVAE